jgi:CheY-like chemotaxis protein
MHNFATAGRRRGCQSRSVLVVDSDPSVLALLSMILEGPKSTDKPKIRVLRARSVKEAMDVLSRPYVRVDLVLSNKSLAQSEGQNIADGVRAIRPQLPVMFMSAIIGAQTIQIHGVAGGSGRARAVVAALDRPRAVRFASAANGTVNSI